MPSNGDFATTMMSNFESEYYTKRNLNCFLMQLCIWKLVRDDGEEVLFDANGRRNKSALMEGELPYRQLHQSYSTYFMGGGMKLSGLRYAA